MRDAFTVCFQIARIAGVKAKIEAIEQRLANVTFPNITWVELVDWLDVSLAHVKNLLQVGSVFFLKF